MRTRAEIRDEFASDYSARTDGEFEYAKEWNEVECIFKAGFDACDAISVPTEEFDKRVEGFAKLKASCAKLVLALEWVDKIYDSNSVTVSKALAEFQAAWPELNSPNKDRQR